MIFKAFSSDQSKFLSLPETGMGYQIIEAQRIGKISKDRFVVLNSELVLDFDIQLGDFTQKIINEGYSNILNKADWLRITTSSIILVDRKKIKDIFLSEGKKIIKARSSGDKGAIDNPAEKANGKEKFVRLSSYEKDKRIDFIQKKLKPGSFTTTEVDYVSCLKDIDDPIDRYALPSIDTIKWAFYIIPKMDDQLQRGVVQPAFGYQGGGIEAYFDKGTSNNTYIETRSYGK